MIKQAEQFLTAGLYSIRDAASLAEVKNQSKIRRWLFGNNSGDAAVIPFYGDDCNAVSFIDLVQMLAIRDIRRSTNITLNKIRETIEFAQSRGISYPFARRHQTYAFSNDLVIRLADGTLLQATGKYKANQLMHPIAQPYMSDLGFDSSGLANVYTPMSAHGRKVVLDPRVRFGAPVVLPCNFTVASLVNAAESEGSDLGAARAMGVQLEDVRLAIRYEEHLQRAAA